MGETIRYDLEYTAAQVIQFDTQELKSLSEQFELARKRIEDLQKIKQRLTEELQYKNFKAESFQQEIEHTQSLGDRSQNTLIDSRKAIKLHLKNLTNFPLTRDNEETHMIQLITKNTALQQDNQQMRCLISDLESQQNPTLKCKNCKTDYRPSVNNDTSCIFHPGRLKFYSCRGCGADEYWTCCMRCTKCNKGCRVSRHRPR